MKKDAHSESEAIAGLLFPIMAMFIRLLHEGKSLPKRLTPQQTKLIMSIYRAGESARVSDLASRSAVTQGTMTVALQRLNKQGLIVREKDHADARAARIYLTKKGKNLAEETHQRTIGVCDSLCAEISPDDRAQFIKSLQFVARTLRNVLGKRGRCV